MLTSFFAWCNKKKPRAAFGLFVLFYTLNFLLIRYLPELSVVQQSKIAYISDLIITAIDVSTLLLLLYVMKKHAFDLSDNSFSKNLKRCLIVGIGAFVLISISDYLFNQIISVPPIAPLPIEERVGSFFVEFIIAVISGPIFEEVLFRGLLLKYVFTDRPVVGIILSSILFALAHPSADWTGFWYHGVPAVILGLTYIYTKSIQVPIGVHVALNLVSHITLKLF